jgi:hypothetical protein
MFNKCGIKQGNKRIDDPKKAGKRKSKNRWIPQPWGITPPPRASIDDLRMEA